MSVSTEWSRADADGVRTLTIGFGARASLRGQRFRRKDQPEPETVRAWPGEWRELLREWLKSDSERSRWTTLLGLSGPLRVGLAEELLAALLSAGFVELDERRDGARWKVAWVRFISTDVLRTLVGLPDIGSLEREVHRIKVLPLPSLLAVAAAGASDCAPAIAVRRFRLLHRLDEWIRNGQRGTRRDFALFATGETKGVADSDWIWLDSVITLEDLGVERHVPLILLRAPITLEHESRMELQGVRDCVGLSPMTMENAVSVKGNVGAWRLVENRTLFDRLARRHGATDGVVWVPGYPPQWWRKAMMRLLRELPSHAHIACDPDPSGFRIALLVGQLCEDANVPWSSWGMDVSALESLPAYLPLSEEDERMLRQLLREDLPVELHEAANWMLERRLKGEQEGLPLALLDETAHGERSTGRAGNNGR